MRIPSNSEMIELWEHGSGAHPVDRALMLLSVCTGKTEEDLARLSVGARDTKLLEIYETLFGPDLKAFARCPACSEPLEYTLSTRDLIPSALEAQPAALRLKDGHVTVQLRLPDSTDLRAVTCCTDVELAGSLLIQRCVVRAEIDGESASPAALPEPLFEMIESALADADPGAEILIDLSCIACSHHWQLALDIERFLWSKISASARRLLHDVHAIASVYGWREPDILALTPVRRQSYVEMTWQSF